jgi:hypothetical protein
MKNSNSNILPKNTTNNGSHLFKGNMTTAAGPNAHKYYGGITTAGVGWSRMAEFSNWIIKYDFF